MSGESRWTKNFRYFGGGRLRRSLNWPPILHFKNALTAAAITGEMRAHRIPSPRRCISSPPWTPAKRWVSRCHSHWPSCSTRSIRAGGKRIHSQIPFVRTPLGTDLTNERLWVTTYVRKRDAWLASVKTPGLDKVSNEIFLKPDRRLKLGAAAASTSTRRDADRCVNKSFGG